MKVSLTNFGPCHLSCFLPQSRQPSYLWTTLGDTMETITWDYNTEPGPGTYCRLTMPGITYFIWSITSFTCTPRHTHTHTHTHRHWLFCVKPKKVCVCLTKIWWGYNPMPSQGIAKQTRLDEIIRTNCGHLSCYLQWTCQPSGLLPTLGENRP